MNRLMTASTFDAAYGPIMERVSWRQDAAPHMSGTFDAVVLFGQLDGTAAGKTQADVWSVRISPRVAVVTMIKAGDTLTRLDDMSAAVLTVKEIVKDNGGWWLKCSAKQRAKHT